MSGYPGMARHHGQVNGSGHLRNFAKSRVISVPYLCGVGKYNLNTTVT